MSKRWLPWRNGADDRARVLDDVLSTALERPEIQDALEFADLTKQDLVDAVREAETSVLAAAESLEKTYRDLVPGTRIDTLNWLEVRPLVGRLLVLLLVPTVGFMLLAWLVAEAIRTPPKWSVAGLVGGVCLTLGVVLVVRTNSLDDQQKPGTAWAYLGLVTSTGAAGWAVVELMGWTWLLLLPAAVLVSLMGFLALATESVYLTPEAVVRRTAVMAAFDEWSKGLLQEGVLPVLYTRINEASKAIYSTTLKVREAPALRRSDYRRMHVTTPASAELTRLVALVGGGSFAIAGPRGAGKTNLLRAFCAGRYREDDQGDDMAVLVSAPVEYVPEEFVLHLFGETCEAAIAYVRRRDRRAAREAERVFRSEWVGRFGRGAKAVVSVLVDEQGQKTPAGLVGLAAAAHHNLVLLMYVRSYNGELAAKGGVKGFEVSRKTGLNLAGRALTYPELVKRFREFLTHTVAELAAEGKRTGRRVGRLLIGIDELDRIGVGDPARRFLNEIKAIFDVPGCHYLVSVSTEAQHDFELSGIGLRSVFDSSFDEVVRVDYLDFEYAQKLLRRYVLGLSTQFHSLAYAFSGGLARQLVRTARTIVELGRDQQERSIEQVAGAIAGTELLRACQATADALTGVDDRAGVTTLLRMLDEHPPRTATAAELKAYGERILASYEGSSERVCQLRDAVGARVCFLGTVLEIFTEDLDEHRMLDADFDSLARARRYVGSNPAAGLGLLNDIRECWALEPIAHQRRPRA
jgi:hypothetical protein